MNQFDLIEEFYRSGSRVHEIMVTHARLVASRALDAARQVSHLNPDLAFIEEAAILHDIAMFMTDMPETGCYGMHPYICHGILGRKLLEEKGLFRHALVCERHIGTGIMISDIQKQNLPLPLRDMRPLSLEEEIIAYADKFYSKNPESIFREHSTEEVLRKLEKYGQEKVEKFREWDQRFGSAFSTVIPENVNIQ